MDFDSRDFTKLFSFFFVSPYTFFFEIYIPLPIPNTTRIRKCRKINKNKKERMRLCCAVAVERLQRALKINISKDTYSVGRVKYEYNSRPSELHGY